MPTYTVTGVRNLDELTGAIDKLWRDETVRAEAATMGIDVSMLPPCQEAVSIQREGAGLEPGTTTIVVAVVAPLAVRVVGDFWARVILPRLEQRFGAGSIRPGQGPQ